MSINRITFILLISFFIIHAGMGWQKQNSGVTFNLYGVQFVDSLTGWVYGDSNLILRTTDGGSNWSTVKLPLKIENFIVGIQFLNKKIGWAWNYTTLWHTVDGGINWTILNNDSTDLYNVEFLDTLNGFGVGMNGSDQGLFKTTDGGKGWALCHNSCGPGAGTFYFFDVNDGWYTCSFCPNGFSISFSGYTSDGGKSWTDSGMPSNIYSPNKMIGIKFTKEDCYAFIECTAFCKRGLYRTVNGGTTWEKCPPAVFTVFPGTPTTTEGSFYTPIATSMTNDGFGWILMGYAVDSTDSTLLFGTSDSGLTWTKQSLPDTTIHSVFLLNGHAGWAVGDSGKIFCYRGTSLHIPVIEECSSKFPRSLQLSGISPNPVGSKAIISFQLPHDSKINLSIHNAAGQLIQTISNRYYKAGTYQIVWNVKSVSGKNVPPGVYFCTMKVMDDKTPPAEKVRMMIVR